MGKMDLMNFLVDLLCSQILTRLPLKEAVRFSAVSRKWCRAWTQLPHLKFSHEFFDSICSTSTKRMVVDIINKIILMQCFGLETFELYNCDWCGSSIDKWLMSISVSGVKCIDLITRDIWMEVSKSLFSCVTLTSPSLKNFKMTDVPALFKGFSQLQTCYLEHVWLSEEAFEVILKLSRVLQSLTVSQCKLPSKLRIISFSLKYLAVLGPSCFWSMEVNCPRLESIKVIDCYGLGMVNKCLPVCVHLETDFRLLQHFATVKSLRKITCFDDASFVEVLQSFPHLEELCIDSFSTYPKDVPEVTLQLANLKSFTVNIGLYDTDYAVNYKNYDVAVSLCSWVLKGAPLLKTVRIVMDDSLDGPDGFDDSFQFVNDILSLARGFPKTKISLLRR